MKHQAKIALATGAGVAGGALVGFFIVRAAVLSRCKRKVKRACARLLPDATCDSVAKGICVGERAQAIRGERLRRGRKVVSQTNATAGAFTVGKTPTPPPPGPLDVLTAEDKGKGVTRRRGLRW